MPKNKCGHAHCDSAGTGFCLDGVKLTPDDLRQYRERASLTQDEAARLVYQSGGRVWRRWEAGDRRINKAAIHLFAVLTDQQFPPRRAR